MDKKDEEPAPDRSGATSSQQTQTSKPPTSTRTTATTASIQGVTTSTTAHQEAIDQGTPAVRPDQSNLPSSRAVNASTQSLTAHAHFSVPATSTIPPTEDSNWDEPVLDADILEDVLFYIGDMGLYQKMMFVGMLPFVTFFVWVYIVQIFITVAPDQYWCNIPELESLNKELRRNLSAPRDATGGWDSCHTYDVDWSEVLETMKPPPPETPKIPCPEGWEFDFSEIPYPSVVTERGWVCEQAAYTPTAQSVFFAGAVAGGLLFGWVADNMGRIPALVGANVIGGIGGISTTFTSGVWDFFFCRFLAGMAFDNCFMIAYILLLEYVGPGHRTWAANMPVAIYGGLAGTILPWIAYLVADWRALLWITAVPMFGVIAAPWFLPESARWLVSRGRINDAVKVLQKFERINKSHVPDNVMKNFIETSKKVGSRKVQSLFTIFRSMLLRITMIYMIIVYSSSAVIYDTLVRITQQFGMDFFITFTINWAIEIPSILALTALFDRLGRRLLTGGSLFIGGSLLFCAMMVPKGAPRVVFGVMARFLINLAFTALWQWGTEILPTPFRASGSAALHMTGFCTSLLSPFIVHSEVLWSVLPLLIVSVWSIIIAILCILLPETKGQEMPQTVADAEKIIQNQSICRKPEMTEFKKALSKVMSHTVSDTIHRNPEGRLTHLRSSRMLR